MTVAAMDAHRVERGLSWQGVAKEMWSMSADLNARDGSHPISPSTPTAVAKGHNTTCQHALRMLAWPGRAPESFVPGENVGPETILPLPSPSRRPRWDLPSLCAALDAGRREHHLSWKDLASELECGPSQLTAIRTARYAINVVLTMRIVQLLGRPAAAFVYAADW
jgi:hypothetical protein